MRSSKRSSRKPARPASIWNRCYEPCGHRPGQGDQGAPHGRSGSRSQSFNAALLHEPWAIQTGSGGPFKVFTPFWRAMPGQGAPAARPGQPRQAGRASAARSAPMPSTIGGCTPRKPDWSGGLAKSWRPGEAGVAGAAELLFPRRRRSPGLRRPPATHPGSTARRPRGSRRICISAKFRRAASARRGRSLKSSRQTAATRIATPTNFSPSSAGANSPITCSFICPTCREPLRDPSSRFPWRRDDAALARLAARPDRLSRSSTPACASFGTPAGCTTACG